MFITLIIYALLPKINPYDIVSGISDMKGNAMSKVVYIEGEGEIIEKKSRFIGNCYPVSSEEEAISYIEAVKKKHYDARHHCYAYSVGKTQPVLRFSDDGEPQGTAGKPILEVITGREITDCLVVVTRYFGGTLLGTGGLLRAYTEAAKAAIDNAEIVEEISGIHLYVTSDYQDIGKLQYIYREEGIDCNNIEYGANVISDLLVPVNNVDTVTNLLIEKTAARVTVEKGEECSYFNSDGKYIIK